jgi:hypothetical protein
LGVVHEPDFSTPVGIEIQLSLIGAPEAVERHGMALMLGLLPAADDLPPREVQMFFAADKDERKAAWDKLMEIRGLSL